MGSDQICTAGSGFRKSGMGDALNISPFKAALRSTQETNINTFTFSMETGNPPNIGQLG
jgi:hypothetical protein